MAATFEESLLANITPRREELRAALHGGGIVKTDSSGDTNVIRHKIAPVVDYLCRQCAQYYDEECRAFEVPHSAAEREQRRTDGPLCRISTFLWTYEVGHPERRKPLVEVVK